MCMKKQRLFISICSDPIMFAPLMKDTSEKTNTGELCLQNSIL